MESKPSIKRRIAVKLTSSRFWGAVIVTVLAGYKAWTATSVEILSVCLGTIVAAWGLYDFSKKLVP